MCANFSKVVKIVPNMLLGSIGGNLVAIQLFHLNKGIATIEEEELILYTTSK